ncbi:CPBP family intramembrane metalloprotease [Protaetiibacter sp. SSC-01]|uniref:CPBP family intramembrane glutamic endopeptidase n=1 Tax=Protaetiibacter sp. SSC-01 TaxID=2759943 RepID=UPI001656AC20|nr:CPBP family intramembrane glutamic endopeptidase [Protaetiibacter sp. SSC-01]QNO38100.1 CPBP family intramembrane metalloprotease [Protaetiibacter sp. SSC-01]
MSDAPARRRPRTKSHYREPYNALTTAAVAYFVVLLLLLLVTPRIPAIGEGGWISQLLSFLIVWVLLVGAVVFAARRFGRGSLERDAGLRIHWIDVGIGLLTGLIVRFAAEGVAPAASTQITLDGVVPVPPLPALLVLIVGAGLIAPVVEELFFRGLLQRSVSGLVPGGRAARIIVSVLVSTPLFVLLHLVTAQPGAWMSVAIIVGMGGLLFGVLTAVTRRLGASIAAHVVFNGLGLLFLYAR